VLYELHADSLQRVAIVAESEAWRRRGGALTGTKQAYRYRAAKHPGLGTQKRVRGRSSTGKIATGQNKVHCRVRRACCGSYDGVHAQSSDRLKE
jgi:hypothetical protein